MAMNRNLHISSITDEELARALVKYDYKLYEVLHPTLKNDIEFIKSMMNIDGRIVSMNIPMTRDLLLHAFKVMPNGAAKIMGVKYNVAECAYNNHAGAFPYDYDIVNAAIVAGVRPEFVEKFCTTKEAFMAVVEHDGMMLPFANAHIRSDPDIVIAAIKQNPAVMKFINVAQLSH